MIGTDSVGLAVEPEWKEWTLPVGEVGLADLGEVRADGVDTARLKCELVGEGVADLKGNEARVGVTVASGI